LLGKVREISGIKHTDRESLGIFYLGNSFILNVFGQKSRKNGPVWIGQEKISFS